LAETKPEEEKNSMKKIIIAAVISLIAAGSAFAGVKEIKDS
jgi:L-arabinose isomerase